MIITSVYYKKFVWDNVILWALRKLATWVSTRAVFCTNHCSDYDSAAENLPKKNEALSGGRKLTSLSDSTDTENEVANVPSSSMLDHKVRFILI
jgi:hypothetical protein